MKYLSSIVFMSVCLGLGNFLGAASIPGSTATEAGGEGKPLGLVLMGEEVDGKKQMKVVDRPWAEAEVAKLAGDQMLWPEHLSKGYIELKWKRNTTKENSVPELSWGRYRLPLLPGESPANLSSKTYLLLSLRPMTSVGATKLRVRLQDQSGKEGADLTINNFNLTPLQANKSSMIAVPLSEALKGLDASKVTRVAIEISGDYEHNKEQTWALDYLGLSAQPAIPGIGQVGMLDIGDKLAFALAPRGTVNKVKVTPTGGESREIDLAGAQFILNKSDLGAAKEFVIQPMAGNVAGAAVTLAVPALKAPANIHLRYAGPARDKEVSPYILGANGHDIAHVQQAGEKVIRWGGNHTSVYNWLEDCTNGSNDWYCMAGGRRKPWTNPLDTEWGHFIKTVRDAGIDVNLTVPIGDWIARSPKPDEPQGSYPRSLYPEQQTFAGGPGGEYGNGKDKDGKPIKMIDKNLTYRPNSPEFQRGWIEAIVKQFGSAANGGVKFYGLDNEIDLWKSSHFDSAPEGISDVDLVKKNIEYARVIKEVDPTAQVFGFAAWGAPGCAGRDYNKEEPKKKAKKKIGQSQAEADAEANKNEPPAEINPRPGQDLLPWYLDEMRKASQKEGRQLIDGLTINWYAQIDLKGPDGKNKSLADIEHQEYDPAVTPWQFEHLKYWYQPDFVMEEPLTSWLYNANRKKLWDPYIPLIPKLKATIDKHYPGLKLAITEYGLGSDYTITGALLHVESVGIFMEHDLWSAQRWFGGKAEHWSWWGIKLLGNYDEKKSSVLGRFRKVVTNYKNLTAYATEKDGKRHVVLVNREYDRPQNVTIPADGATSYELALLAEPTGKQIVRVPSQAVEGEAVKVTLPPFSAMVVVMEVGK